MKMNSKYITPQMNVVAVDTKDIMTESPIMHDDYESYMKDPFSLT